MLEKELAKYFIDYLSDFDLYFEVDYGRCIDIVGINNNTSIAVEVKTSFNFKVLEQAIDNAIRFNYSYIAVPKFKDSYFQERLCEQFGVGLLILQKQSIPKFDNGKMSYEYKYKVYQSVKPKLNRHASVKKITPFLHKFSKASIAGSKNGDGGKITAFSITIENLEYYVLRHSGCTIKEAIKGISHHYSSDSSACRNIYQWIRQGIIKTIKHENRKLYLIENKTEAMK